MCRIHLSEPSIVARPRNGLWPDFFLAVLVSFILGSLLSYSTQSGLFLIAEITFFLGLLQKCPLWFQELLKGLNAIEDEMGLIPTTGSRSNAHLPLNEFTRQTLFASRLLN